MDAGGIVLEDRRANFFGIESRGFRQIRGNGRLTLTEGELRFAQWLPRRTLRIPREHIVAVSAVRSHLGKTVGRALLQVRFVGDGGQEDTAAWFVRDLDRWLATLG